MTVGFYFEGIRANCQVENNRLTRDSYCLLRLDNLQNLLTLSIYLNNGSNCYSIAI